MKRADGDPRKLEEALGLPSGSFNKGEIVRVDVFDPSGDGLRVPSGNEAGANEHWIPGGKLPSGMSKGVIDVGKLNSKGFKVSEMDDLK